MTSEGSEGELTKDAEAKFVNEKASVVETSADSSAGAQLFAALFGLLLAAVLITIRKRKSFIG